MILHKGLFPINGCMICDVTQTMLEICMQQQAQKCEIIWIYRIKVITLKIIDYIKLVIFHKNVIIPCLIE